ncbi:MAG: hypothetical protein Q9M24_03925 [Mariprofundaceae bacterium]|nr:hypothetical protein [Mariprofundaceae bacterium]
MRERVYINNNINRVTYGFIYVVSILLILFIPVTASAQDKQEYLYQRDVSVPAYQTLREFFDIPNRPGKYEVTLVSDSMGPLTFRILRVRGEHEQTVKRMRSYHMKSHEFHAAFNNPRGQDDLIVEMTNSNPAVNASVSVYVVELP